MYPTLDDDTGEEIYTVPVEDEGRPLLFEDYDLYGDDPDPSEVGGSAHTGEPVRSPGEPLGSPAERGLAAEKPYRVDADGHPNYHFIEKLTDDLLPELDFFRYDNFFAARPAHGFFIDRESPLECAPRLFDQYWLEGEVAVLFADSGAGKSILATQVAQSIASGISIRPFYIDTPPQRVVYFDLELSQEQFDRRYSHEDPSRPAHFPFHRNLIRNPPHPAAQRPSGVPDETAFICDSIVDIIDFSQARVAIIDNITWLNNSSQIGNAATRVMKALAQLKRRKGLSILVLAHTPKRNLHSPICANDLQGSRMIANFADSVFALGHSRLGPDVRYLKSIKCRSLAQTERARVATLRIEKDVCLLGMKFIGFSDERDHIGWMSSPKEPELMELIEKVLELHKQGLSQRKIGQELGVSASTVNRCLKVAVE
ncbi:MAG TPA: AAA family ATPase [Pyrinomonadaceae bacterium]|nr:AAA family ATPase [Pyrinomonadaceae bacterium]HMP66101.1 AAA family ATPase [Pyrinomonadaceae bacterium]